MNEKVTIVAPATPEGRSALAMIRVSGQEAFNITEKCLCEKNIFRKMPSRHIQLYVAKEPLSGKTIDQITAIKYSTPRSFTGENMVEIICHGGQIIIKKIFNALLKAGARPAERGEFTRRALLNGKVTIMKAEAIQGLIDSSSETELLFAQKLYYGKSQELTILRKKLVELLEKIEAIIEFEETDSVKDISIEGKKTIEDVVKQIKKDIEKKENIKVIEDGIRVVIAGPVNAGKSTLFNTLIGKNRAIVHREPGTTRDVVSEKILIHSNEIQLYDSAGIRKTEQEIEREGIRRSRDAISDAGITIWVTAADEELTEEELCEILSIQEKNKIICVINKTDISEGKKKREIIEGKGIPLTSLSLMDKKKEGIENLIYRIQSMIKRIKNITEIPDFVLNKRQEEIVRKILKEITCARDEWGRPEIVAQYLKNGLDLMDDYFGKILSDEILNRIFVDFCIGK